MNLIKIIEQVSNNSPSAFFYTPGIYAKSKSYLFLQPEKKVIVNDKDNIKNAFNKIEKHLKQGFIGWGMMPYEYGYLFDRKLERFFDDSLIKMPLQFFFYSQSNVRTINSSDISFNSRGSNYLTEQYKLKDKKINVSKYEYFRNIEKIKKYIAQGDTYQVNYTLKSKFKLEGSLTSLFVNMIFNQSSMYTALINVGENYILSFSPELFFSISNKRLQTKPMKGTITRGLNAQDDCTQKYLLAASEKEKAENVMIVDLLRNDFGKISEYNSVKVKSLFDIEKYESLFQMTSSIDSKLKGEIYLGEIFRKIFPCGSITGAPKISTMKIIKELESESRGIYTGAIGIVKKTSCTFNVAIRTMKINKETMQGEMGIGSGIVWDSDPEKEYKEVILKSKFLFSSEKYFELFESILIENKKPFLLAYHYERLKEASEFFQFSFDKGLFYRTIDKIIDKAVNNKKYKIKIILNKWGKIKYEVIEIKSKIEVINVAVSNKVNKSQNKFLYFKTTNRSFYDNELDIYKPKNIGEVIFLNENGEVTEGTYTNIFVHKKRYWFTPDVGCGLLPGTYRKYFLQKNKGCLETKLFLSDLLQADEIILTNSVRKEIRVRNLYTSENGSRCLILSKEFYK